jgi:hypothetical protein
MRRRAAAAAPSGASAPWGEEAAADGAARRMVLAGTPARVRGGAPEPRRGAAAGMETG